MKRFPAYDPPEYVDWRPDPALVREFGEAWTKHPGRAAIVTGTTREVRLDLYRGMVRTRLHDIMLKRWVRQGIISKAWLGTGEEATTVGPVHALNRAMDVVAPMIRNAGACSEMGMPVASMLRGYLGTYDSPSSGRDGHVGDFSYRVLQPISNIGAMPPVVAGVGLAFKILRHPAVVLTWIGDGSSKAGPVHEALNFASVLKLPVVFIVQNNQVALGTPVGVSHLPGRFNELAEAYGCYGESFDGNNVLDAFGATRAAATRCREGGGPVILAAETFRMGGHATHDEREARDVLPASLFEHWGKRDPIGLYEQYLVQDGTSAIDLQRLEVEVSNEVDEQAAVALASRDTNDPPPESALHDVYASAPEPRR